MNIVDLLNTYDPPSEQERLNKQAMLDFARQHADCFSRNNLVAHFTGSAWLLDRSGENALLLHHRKLDRWFQLGGHADGDTDLARVALKEAQEESGIQGIGFVQPGIFDLDIHEIPANAKEPRHFHYDVRFLLQVTSDELLVQNAESKELRWVSKNVNDLPTDNLSVVRMFHKWTGL
ncbi:MAG: NUDIX hydrolase [Myxococcota bacterium]